MTPNLANSGTIPLTKNVVVTSPAEEIAQYKEPIARNTRA
jgi:hypothetical protein